MIPVYAIAGNAVSALGLTISEHWQKVMRKETGLRLHIEEQLSAAPFYGSRLSDSQWQRISEGAPSGSSPFEQMCLYSAREAMKSLPFAIADKDTILVLSTTKGNIEWLGEAPDERLTLHSSAAVISAALGLSHKPIVVSHACISGVAALVYAQRLLQAGRYKHAIVIGADRFTKFVLSGFQSFQAIADEPCRPFDAARKGINLGEAAATIILSSEAGTAPLAQILSGSTSNDANHISGPSRTGAELALAIRRSLQQANIHPEQIDMISAHGTATLYNDEMESKAFALSEVNLAPVHSLKGYTGHTLGAAGIIESAMIVESLQQQILIPSVGFSTIGVSEPLHIMTEPKAARIRFVLKTASGFGGCNAAAVWAAL